MSVATHGHLPSSNYTDYIGAEEGNNSSLLHLEIFMLNLLKSHDKLF